MINFLACVVGTLYPQVPKCCPSLANTCPRRSPPVSRQCWPRRCDDKECYYDAGVPHHFEPAV
eukprot:3898633-Pyramimonas_sp.AAC.1